MGGSVNGRSAAVLSARQAALAARRRGREERAEAERRRDEGILELLVSVARRAEADAAAGAVVRRLIVDEGMTAREIVQWSGGELDSREVTRLRRLGDAVSEDAAADIGSETGAGGPAPGHQAVVSG